MDLLSYFVNYDLYPFTSMINEINICKKSNHFIFSLTIELFCASKWIIR